MLATSKGKFIVKGVKIMLLTSSSSLFNYNNRSMFEESYEELGSTYKDFRTH
jgi:hypothetical protein